MKFIDLTGKKFGRLLVLYKDETKNGRIYWKCRCDCGAEKIVLGQHLRSGKTISCKCASNEKIGLLKKTHGQSKTRLYQIWLGLRNRCYQIKNKSYENYGNRGITVCDEWFNSYECFRDWSFSNGYQENLSIDRIDNNGNYEPSNCRWSTPKEQSNNTRRIIKLYYNGEKFSAKQLADHLNINYKKFIYGLHKTNFDIEKSIDYAKCYKKGVIIKL